MSRSRTSLTFASIVIVLAACGPAARSTSGEASSAASAAPSEARESTGGALPSLTEGAVADLEAWIPDVVAGVTMQKLSMQGTDSLLQFDDQTISTLLQDLGVSAGDVSLAVGIGYSAELNFSARMFVFHAAGVESDRLKTAFKKAIDSGADAPLNWVDSTVGGKQVETAVEGNSGNYLYVKGDVLVFMFTSDSDIAAEIISGLP